MRLGEVIDQSIATAIFDCGVNRGISVGVKYAQRVCNLKGPGVMVDGKLGDQTLASINAQNRSFFIQHLSNLMDAGYDAIVDAHPQDAKYQRGWLARSNRLLTLI